MIKELYYYPRTHIASDILNFVTEAGGLISLIKEIPTLIKEEDLKYLTENDEEFKKCVELDIILVKEKESPTPASTDTVSTELPIEKSIGAESASETTKSTTTTTKTVKGYTPPSS